MKPTMLKAGKLVCAAMWLDAAVGFACATPPTAPRDKQSCAVFGADLSPTCISFPNWTTGTWAPPADGPVLHVLVIGGGGGGGGTVEEGIGGTGASSGRVVTAEIRSDGKALAVRVGRGGRGGIGFNIAGRPGGNSQFGEISAAGGEGGQPDAGGGTGAGTGGESAGGGAGGGYYTDGHGGRGGDGGMKGGNGSCGEAGTDSSSPIQPRKGGIGTSFPVLSYREISMLPGAGGKGGAFGTDRPGYGGGGGGGGGGVHLSGAGMSALTGASGGGAQAKGGEGGLGFGAGGGGGGNYVIGAHGGAGAPGVVYVEWVPALIAAK